MRVPLLDLSEQYRLLAEPIRREIDEIYATQSSFWVQRSKNLSARSPNIAGRNTPSAFLRAPMRCSPF